MLYSHRLTGGYASSNFAAVLKPPGDAAEFTAVLKFSYAAMPREEIERLEGLKGAEVNAAKVTTLFTGVCAKQPFGFFVVIFAGE